MAWLWLQDNPTLSASTQPRQSREGLSSTISPPSIFFNRRSNIDMSFRKTVSGVKKDIKGFFRGSKRNKDKKGPGTSGEAADVGESLSRSESPFAGSGDHSLGGSGSNPVGGHIGSVDRPAQRDGSHPVFTGGSDPNQEGEGTGDVDPNEGSQTKPSLAHSDVEDVVGSGLGGRSEQVPSDASNPGSAKPQGV